MGAHACACVLGACGRRRWDANAPRKTTQPSRPSRTIFDSEMFPLEMLKAAVHGASGASAVPSPETVTVRGAGGGVGEHVLIRARAAWAPPHPNPNPNPCLNSPV